MRPRSLDQFDYIRLSLYAIRRTWLRLRYGVRLDPTSRISLSSRIVARGRGSVVIDRGSIISFKTLLITRDGRGLERPIRIGKHCLVGGGSMIMPGVQIGDGSIIAAGAVVFNDVPSGCIVGGNPARVLRGGIETERFGRLKGIIGNEGKPPPALDPSPRESV